MTKKQEQVDGEEMLKGGCVFVVLLIVAILLFKACTGGNEPKYNKVTPPKQPAQTLEEFREARYKYKQRQKVYEDYQEMKYQLSY